MKYLVVLISVLVFTSCKTYSQNGSKDLDTAYLYFPFKVLFNYESFELENLEKQNIDYILEKYYYPNVSVPPSNICLLALVCKEEVLKNEKIVMERLFQVYNYLVNEKKIPSNKIKMQIGGTPNPKICENKDKQGVIIQYCE